MSVVNERMIYLPDRLAGVVSNMIDLELQSIAEEAGGAGASFRLKGNISFDIGIDPNAVQEVDQHPDAEVSLHVDGVEHMIEF